MTLVGEPLVNQVRARDFVARIGGDEFVAVAMGERGVTAAIAARLPSLISVQPYLRNTGVELFLSASFGLSHMGSKSDDFSNRLSSADQEMYLTKFAIESQEPMGDAPAKQYRTPIRSYAP